MTRRQCLKAVAPAPFLSSSFVAPPGEESVGMLADTAGNFLASLNADQRARAEFAFEDQERFNWHYVPRERKGLALRDMTASQRHLAYALAAAGLSSRGMIKATTIMSLEEILRALENASPEYRNPEKYYFTVFGRPSSESPWGFRIEGHHLSLNLTIAGNRAAGGPSFFGANPAEVRHGERRGLRTLAAEEDLARDLLAALDRARREAAMLSPEAYPEILTGNSRKAALEGQPSGLAAARMTDKQRDLLGALVAEYARNLSGAIAEARLEKYRKAGGDVHFGWAGSSRRGEPHYYRVQGPGFLIEYDNTQNGANHIHSVWRDLEGGDWGLDLLARHYSISDPSHGHGVSAASKRSPG